MCRPDGHPWRFDERRDAVFRATGSREATAGCAGSAPPRWGASGHRGIRGTVALPARGLRAQAAEADAVGPELHALGVRRSLGMNADPLEMYAWGWDELHRLEAQMAVTAERIEPGAGLDAAMAVLRDDPARSPRRSRQPARVPPGGHGPERSPSSTAPTSTFPKQIHRVECREAPPGTAAAMYYTPPVGGLQPARGGPGTRRRERPGSRSGPR